MLSLCLNFLDFAEEYCPPTSRYRSYAYFRMVGKLDVVDLGKWAWKVHRWDCTLGELRGLIDLVDLDYDGCAASTIPLCFVDSACVIAVCSIIL